MVEKWYKETWSDRDFNKNIKDYPNVEITGHLPSKGEIRLAGPEQEVCDFISKLTS